MQRATGLRIRLRFSVASWGVAAFLSCGRAWSQLTQSPDAPLPAAGPPTPASESITAPSLQTQEQAAYPDVARRERREGNVGWELTIEADGSVSDVKVITTAGHGFDEAAAEAARKFLFEPARRDGHRGEVQDPFDLMPSSPLTRAMATVFLD